MNIKFRRWDCILKETKYTNNGRLALELALSNGEPVAMATTNIIWEPLEPNEIIIKNYAENEGIYDCLVKHGVISKVKRYSYSNHVSCPIVDYLLVKKKNYRLVLKHTENNEIKTRVETCNEDELDDTLFNMFHDKKNKVSFVSLNVKIIK